MIADICVFACTGNSGASVARHIVELANSDSTPSKLVLLLAGRNLAKVHHVRDSLLAEQNEMPTKNSVNIVAHSEAVSVDDDEALHNMVKHARVVANCIDVDCHPCALENVAEACAKAGVHYVDLATRGPQLQSHLDNFNKLAMETKSKIVPACGFDYALMDVAALKAEQCFAERYKEKPNKIQLTLAIRTGPLGFKWPVSFVKKQIEYKLNQKKKAAASMGPLHLASSSNTTTGQRSRSGNRIFAFIQPLSSWSIPWPLGADAMTFLLCQRQWVPEDVDARIALPHKLWKAAAWIVYSMVVAILFIPLLCAAQYLKAGAFQRGLLWILPVATLGFFSNDNDLCQRSKEEMRVESVVTLSSSEGRSLCYHVRGPSPVILNPLCMALSSLELAKMPLNGGGVLTPAMAVGETDFWTHLCKSCNLKVQITE